MCLCSCDRKCSLTENKHNSFCAKTQTPRTAQWSDGSENPLQRAHVSAVKKVLTGSKLASTKEHRPRAHSSQIYQPSLLAVYSVSWIFDIFGKCPMVQRFATHSLSTVHARSRYKGRPGLQSPLKQLICDTRVATAAARMERERAQVWSLGGCTKIEPSSQRRARRFYWDHSTIDSSDMEGATKMSKNEQIIRLFKIINFKTNYICFTMPAVQKICLQTLVKCCASLKYQREISWWSISWWCFTFIHHPSWCKPQYRCNECRYAHATLSARCWQFRLLCTNSTLNFLPTHEPTLFHPVGTQN